MFYSTLQIFFCVILGVFGQLLIKRGVMLAKTKTNLILQYLKIFTTPEVIAGISLYIISSLVWVKLLQKVPLSYAYPMISIGYVVTLILAKLFLGESIPLIRWIGMILICTGVILISQS
jgi:drug/metabolite transporter (DMT)-like permease